MWCEEEEEIDGSRRRKGGCERYFHSFSCAVFFWKEGGFVFQDSRALLNLIPSPDPRYPEYLIYQVCGSERLVRWCLDHGAHVAYPDVEPYTPLLDYVAQSSSSSGNTAIFKLLIDRGAKLGRRTLHLAARSSAAAAGGGRPEILQRNMEVVRFLVEEMGCDVNGMDVPEGKQYGNHYGTPLNYIAHGSGGGGEEMIVRYLLEVGFFFVVDLHKFKRGVRSDWFGRVLLCRDHG